MTLRPSADEVFLQMAEALSQRGTCARRKVGAIITDKHGRILSAGYNGVAAKVLHCSEGHPCQGVGFSSGEGLDACTAIHAEANALLFLADPYAVHTCYVTVTPCASCLKLLMGTTCERIVSRSMYSQNEHLSQWVAMGRKIIITPSLHLVTL